MILDLLRMQPRPSDATAVCIVGAGAAGIVLALDLARRGKRVLLLEGGGREIEEDSQDPYVSEVVGLPHRGIHTGRFRVHGGTTTKWGGQILELEPRDFEQRAAVEDSGWPFPKSELTRYYDRALEYEGLARAALRDEDVWREIGEVPPLFPGLEIYFTRWCPEPNFARLYGETISQHPGIALWLHANAVEPLLEDDMLRGVRCRTLTGIEAVFRANQFVFCLGGIESSRFFLQPREGGVPWNASGLLGKHFQDHIDCNAAIVEPTDSERFHQIFDNVFSRGFKYHPKLRLRASEQHGLNVAATMAFSGESEMILAANKATAKKILRGRVAQILPADINLAARHFPLLARQLLRYKLRHRSYNPADSRIFLRVHCEQEPKSQSSIALADTCDALGLFRARLNWQISEKELDAIRQFVQKTAKSLSGIARIRPSENLDTDFRPQCDDSNHHMGGMRMSSSSKTGVVDSDLRIYGLRNAYVCSSAVFPCSGFSNPTHTLLALTLRLGEHLG